MSEGQQGTTPDGQPREPTRALGPTPAVEPREHKRGINRRTFLTGAGAVGGAVTFDVIASRANKATNLISPVVSELNPIFGRTRPSFSILLRRREDFLFLRIDAYNLVPKGQKLVRKSGGADTFIVVGFAPQHLTEQAYFDPGETPKSPGQSLAALAYPSRLVFGVPAGKAIPLTVAGLLDWSGLDPILVPAAAYSPIRFRPARAGGGDIAAARSAHAANRGPGPPPGPLPKIRAPTAYETALELPWRLVISPTSSGAWSHPVKAIGARGWTELWHTRLASSAKFTAPDGGPFRAVWNYDTQKNGKPMLRRKTPPPDDNSPFRTSLDSRDRYQIVRATSDFTLTGRADVPAAKLWLSARGGFLDSDGKWELSNSSGLDLEEWRHLATLGRDQYVKVVTKGFLFPFGHRVVLIKVTERRFEKVGGQIVATSRQHVYLVVRQPLKSYDPAATFGVANDSRDFPFRELLIKTLRTPDLDMPQWFVPVAMRGVFSNTTFVPRVGGKPFLFHFVGTDWVGQQAAFVAPAVFVQLADGFHDAPASDVRSTYNALSPTDPVRVGQFTGQQVAFGPSHTPGDTNLAVNSITFGAGAGAGGSDIQFENFDQPRTYPNVAQASVRLTAAEQAAGGQVLNKTPVVNYNPTYVSNGFNAPANLGNLFMEIAPGSQPNVNFGGGSAGGVMTPNMLLTGLSRSLGPVAGDLSNILGGTFDPASIFNLVQARILGGVDLVSLIAKAPFSGDNPDPKALRISYSTAGSKLTTNLHWTPDIGSNPIISKESDSAFSFVLDATVLTDLANPANSTYQVTGDLKGFVVSLMTNSTGPEQFIAIHFNELSFNAQSGQKSNVSVDINNVEFLGVLKFVEQLQNFMDFSGDGGPKIQIEPDGISASLAVTLPPIAVGIFSLSNVGVDAGFNLPFDGSPARVRFSFSTRDDPFTLSVAIFGGGGFFGLAIGTDGVELIEGSLDFGAMASIDLGVASGSVQLVAGIYFAYGQINPPSTQTGCVLTGFVKLDGSLSILGIITLSLEFDLSLTYQSLPSPEVTGTATLTVSISVLFFSASVSMTASKTFGGGQVGMARDVGGGSGPRALRRGRAGDPSPPTFADQVPTQAIWNAYCAAFATN